MTPRIPEWAAREVASLYLKTAAEVHRYTVRLMQGDTVKADDIVQETFHDVAVKWDAMRLLHVDRQRAWLFTVAGNKAISAWRAGRSAECLPGEIPGQPDETHDKVLSTMALDKCWEALRKMPPRRYQCAYLHWHDGLKAADVAKILGIKPSTVRVQLKLARDALVREIGPTIDFGRIVEVSDER